MEKKVEEGSRIRIRPVTRLEFFHNKEAVVDQVKRWGVQASVIVEEGEYPVRLTWEEFDVIREE